MSSDPEHPDPAPSTSPAPPVPSGSTEEQFSTLYQELHTLAQHHLHRRGGGVTLGTTSLLHELYLNMADRNPLRSPGRMQFLAYASRAMRGLIIDYARRRGAVKRGGEFVLTSFTEETPLEAPGGAKELSDLGDALDELAQTNAPLAELVDLHFFCGLSLVEIAALRGVSERTVQRDWRVARLLLHRELHTQLGDPE
jgi:RNA polymerase sigma factor (TIGR02999 family)